MKFLGLDNILCLSPHPDDIEYSMSGTIAKYDETKFHIYVLTTGTQSDTTSNINRFKEVKKFWSELDLPNVKLIYGRTNINFDNTLESQWLDIIESDIDMNNMDGICATSGCDSHFEHLITNRVMIALGRNKPLTLLEYRSPSTLQNWEPNLYVNLKEFYELKKDTLRLAFKSQIDALYFSEECLRLFHEDYINKKKGVGFVEQFKIKTINI